MTHLRAADRSQIDTELDKVTSAKTAKVRMQSAVDIPWDSLATRDQLDAPIERTMRKQTIWLISTLFAFNGLLAAWITAIH